MHRPTAFVALALAGALIAAQADPLASRTKGRADAPITIYEMSDFQCPFCRQFAVQTLPTLTQEYLATGKARLIYINYPIRSSHPNADAAAQAALCAGRQGAPKFWAVHDALFERQTEWARLRDPLPFFDSLAAGVGVSRARFSRCLRDGETRAEVQADVQASERAGAQGTPSFYIEGYLIRGAAPIEYWRQVLDSVHRAKTSSRGVQQRR
jgi:protein-disulfide isomerase